MINKEATTMLRETNCNPCKHHKPNSHCRKIVYCSDCEIGVAIEALKNQDHEYTRIISKLDDIVFDHTDDIGYVAIMTRIAKLYGCDWSEKE